MKLKSTLFLKLAVVSIGAPVFALCIFLIFWIAKQVANSGSGPEYYLYPILGSMLISAVPFFIALFKAFRLLNYIDRDLAFSKLSVDALKSIKLCAAVISGLYFVSMPFFYILGELDDAPGVILMGMTLTFASAVVAVFAAVLQRLLEEAVYLKSEHDFTI
ncbi:hypothetical protein EUAN_02120 [Andreesenia angusta]|uniref:DUF2975 domain-containing protein n=1 Tax=Andreesenia angusta TaxID=39480 RepID=A0A1S1V9T7_9FIRM|nr:DUF2975 domain-containing protein [Andreesenia angusta]OHW63348.1 hypothetical protein EUAN_02120 [Andreesenia angusta]